MCGLASPLGVRAHSTRGVASQALFKGSSLEDGPLQARLSRSSLDVRMAPGSQVLAA